MSSEHGLTRDAEVVVGDLPLTRAHEELKAIKVGLESENLYLRETVVPKGNLSGIVATSPSVCRRKPRCSSRV